MCFYESMETWRSGRRVIWERVSYTELTKEGKKFETRELRVCPIVQKTRGYDRRGDFYSIHIEVERRPEDRFLPKNQGFDLEDRNFLHIISLYASKETLSGWVQTPKNIKTWWSHGRNCEEILSGMGGFKGHSFDFLMNNGSYKGRPVGHIAIYPGGYWVVGLKKTYSTESFDSIIGYFSNDIKHCQIKN